MGHFILLAIFLAYAVWVTSAALDAWHNCTVTSEAIENLIADIQHVEKLTVEMAMDCYVETYDNGFSIGEKT